MSFRYIHAMVALCVGLLAGCVQAPQIKQPPAEAVQAAGASISELKPTSAQKYGYTDLDGTYFAVSGANGSLTVGLLFGAIGVAANIVYINSVNKSRAEKITEVTSKDLSALLLNRVPSLKAPMAVAAYKITPAGNIVFTSDTQYWLGCTITAELPQSDGKAAWSGRYAGVVEGTFDAANANDTAKAAAGLEPCLETAYRLFEDHVSGKLGPFEDRTVSSRALVGGAPVDQTYKVAVSRLPGHVVINDFLGVAELRASEITQIK